MCLECKCSEDKVSKKDILAHLDRVEVAVRRAFKKGSSGAEEQLAAFINGLNHAREIVKITTHNGFLIEKRVK